MELYTSQQTSPAFPPHTGVARFLDACYLRRSDATPIWFMRQAGRCIAEYQELRKKYDVITMLKTPELCSLITLMPVETYGVDAAVLYADIMLPLEGMGIDLEINPAIGPIVHNPVRSKQDVEALRLMDAVESVPYILEALKSVKREVEGKQALIGFAGAPFTIACYLIEGRPSRDYTAAKTFMYSQPVVWDALMNKLAEVMANYAVAQIEAGADAIQISDSWVGALSPATYRRFVMPHTKRIFDAIKATGHPALHFATGASALLELLTETGGEVIGVDSRVDLDEAWRRVGYDHALQGNLDPALMLTPWPVLESGMNDVLERAAGRPGHIFNLGHGVPAATETDQLRRLVDAVHTRTQR